jgi:hypothetical protein
MNGLNSQMASQMTLFQPMFQAYLKPGAIPSLFNGLKRGRVTDHFKTSHSGSNQNQPL